MIPENYRSEKQKIESEIEKLKKEADELQQRHRGPAVQSIIAAMREYDITPEEINAAFGGRRGAGRSRTPLPAKYRDPASGKGWSGRGRTPGWLVQLENQGRSRDEFLI